MIKLDILPYLKSGLKKYLLFFIILFLYLMFNFRTITLSDFEILARHFSLLAFAVIGVGVITISDGVVLSTGAQIALVSTLGAYFIYICRLPIWSCVILIILLSILFAVVCSFTVVTFRLPTPLLTFILVVIVSGVNTEIHSQIRIMPENNFAFLAGYSVCGIPFSLLTFIFFALFTYVFLNRTYIGRCLYATGINREILFQTDVQVAVVEAAAWIVGTLCIDTAGFLTLSMTGAGEGGTMDYLTLDVITALSIGRVRLWGGKGTLTGMILGTIGVVLLNSWLMDSADFMQSIVKGVLIVSMLVAEKNASDSL